jgi:phage terminase small subunit
MVKPLTPKQEKFAQGVASGKSQADAYRAAYDCKKSTPSTVQKLASELMKLPHVSGRVNELRKPAVEAVAITVQDLIRELEEARVIAMTGEKPQAAAMVSATVAKAKLLGLEAPTKSEVSGSFEVVAPWLKSNIQDRNQG